MDKFQLYTVDALLQDEQFIDWVKSPTPEKAKIWEDRIAGNPENMEMVRQAREMMDAFDFAPAHVSPDFYAALKSKIDKTIAATKQTPVKKAWLMPQWLKLAAAVGGVIITGGILYYTLTSGNELTVISSKYAETKVVVLPDQSRVVLNAHSTVKYARHWNQKNREVWMDGEGYFVIQHLEDKPQHPLKFVVHAGKVDVEVLGTQFNIRERDSSTQVLLTTGKVTLKLPENNRQLLLQPNDLATYYHQTKTLIAKQVNPQVYIAWMEHKFIFNRLSLQEVCKTVQHYFGTAFIIQDSLMAAQEFSGTLELLSQDTLVQTLTVLLGTPVKKINHKVIIYAK